MLPDLLDQIPHDQSIDIVTEDGACDTRTCYAAIAARGAAAVIPPRRNGKPCKERTPGATARNDALRSCRRLGRAIWKRWTGYHRRSLAEAKMRCLKLLGERVMSRDFDRQVAELQIRAAILNRFTALGTPLTQRMEQVCPGKGKVRPSRDLRNKAGGSSFRNASKSSGSNFFAAMNCQLIGPSLSPSNSTPLFRNFMMLSPASASTRRLVAKRGPLAAKAKSSGTSPCHLRKLSGFCDP